MTDKRKYEVGYGKPPEHTRFKKGQSGNPKGRPKDRRNFATELEEVLTAPVSITEGGQPKRVSSRQAALMRLRERALKGDIRALSELFGLALKYEADRDARMSDRSLTASEAQILERYAQKVLDEFSSAEIEDGSAGSKGDE
ncbi:DUF5681 domain-containing protein [Aestuariicoccus sp. MJ-SS9]|uniref:DUF5681 domain-containing protein n=1 Tax=Aestuariicoccus sp. MJ-SS9 TaxID=3079855 RepID=UPI002914EE64|nr:DUF5681 domain-containing protein [Aestuariicoccus sp. MJ-SS9]MDU8912248.1 DUF5681 domain-containing protein [Aestuariicoccus sp. MJ-SS9]